MKKNRRNVWIIVGVIAVVIVAMVIIIATLRTNNSSSTAYQTVTVQRGTLTASVEGSGTVASIQSANLAWQTSGQVEKVNAQTGDVVHAGDVLASLAGDSVSPSILSAQVDLETARQNLNNLLHPDVATVAAAQSALQTAYTNFFAAFNNLNNTTYNYESYGSSSLYNTQAVKFSAASSDLGAALLPAQDVNTQSYYWAARAEQMGQKDMDYAAIKASLSSKLAPGVADKVDALVAAQGEYDTAVADFAATLSDNGISINVNKTMASYFNSVASLSAAQEKLYNLLITPDPAAVAAAQAKVDAAQTTVNEMQLSAPFDGNITQVDVYPNDTVSNGTQAFRIDNLSQMVIKVQITEIDVNNIKIGQSATITFDAIPNKTYHGKVLQADLAGTAGQNSVNFTITVELTDSDALVKPGMAANVSIVTNRVENALLVPSTAIFTDSSGQTYVYLIQNGTPVAVNVTVGAVSDSSSQITGDALKEGDVIVLSFASSSSSSNFRSFGMGGIVGAGGGNERPVATP